VSKWSMRVDARIALLTVPVVMFQRGSV
jgi:hypothetical protein